MELSSVLLVLDFGWAHLIFEVAELALAKFNLGGGFVLVVSWGNNTAWVLAIDRDSSFFGERFAIEILRVDLGNVARVARDMLSFYVLGGATEPVLAVFGVVTVLKHLINFILGWWVRVESSSGELWFAHSDLNVVVGWLVASVGDDSVNITSGAAVHIIFTGNKACVAGQVLLVVLDSFSRHYFQLLINLI